MAYLRDIPHLCSIMNCVDPAKVEVMDREEQVMGCFCRRHGRERVRELEKLERQETQNR